VEDWQIVVAVRDLMKIVMDMRKTAKERNTALTQIWYILQRAAPY